MSEAHTQDERSQEFYLSKGLTKHGEFPKQVRCIPSTHTCYHDHHYHRIDDVYMCCHCHHKESGR